MINNKETIKCPCGRLDTGLNPKGFLYCPPPQGVKCPHCGGWVFPPKNIGWPIPKPWKPLPDTPKPWGDTPITPWVNPYPPFKVNWEYQPPSNGDYALWC